MLELICFVVVALSVTQDFSEIEKAFDRKEKQVENITAKITKATTSSSKEPTTISYSVRKKGDFLAVETDDGMVYVFGPHHSFAAQQNSEKEYVLVGSPLPNFRPMDVVDWKKIGIAEKQLMARHSQGRIPISFPQPWLSRGIKEGLFEINGPESVSNSPSHVMFELRQKSASNESEGKITTRYIFDSNNNFRPVSSISNSEKSNTVNAHTWDYQDPVNYQYTNEVTYEGGETSKEDFAVSISDATWKDSDFTLAYYGISAQQATGIKPSWWLIWIGVFLIVTVLAVKIRRRSNDA